MKGADVTGDSGDRCEDIHACRQGGGGQAGQSGRGGAWPMGQVRGHPRLQAGRGGRLASQAGGRRFRRKDLAWDYPGVAVQVNAYIHSFILTQ